MADDYVREYDYGREYDDYVREYCASLQRSNEEDDHSIDECVDGGIAFDDDVDGGLGLPERDSIEECVEEAIDRCRAALQSSKEDDDDALQDDAIAFQDDDDDDPPVRDCYPVEEALRRYSERASALLIDNAGVPSEEVEGLEHARAMLNGGHLQGHFEGVIVVDGDTMWDILSTIYYHPSSHPCRPLSLLMSYRR